MAIFDEGIGKIAEQYLSKGSTVYLEGQLETRKWQDQAGADKYTTEVVLRPFNSKLTLLGGKPDGERREQQGGAPAGGRNDMDDEIPFAPEWRA